MREEVFIAVQDLPTPRREVFAFFSDPANLEALTPPWLNFEVLTPRPLPQGEGALFDYRIRVRGLPIRWRTLIETFIPGERFVDRQIAGPYAIWHHTHRFEDLPDGGTRMTDQVRYRVGWGFIGHLVTALWVRKDVAKIFAYRKQVLAERFKPAPAPRTAP
ncbi:MAG: SRPBCC family protein [Geothrix sp.]|uniref:SRPBCC family protein n=1 Tax=Geothrix sp. TaxID=1962974 RepID=UPI001810A797|nr:SRPBCC family protein [Geothrix sp.]NWJ42264.1 SRPBCC family protein [Geothrix sp.]WIL19769.1 MAG: SRPBCC family protein [Geothrix sp.]